MSPAIGHDRLERSGPTVETVYPGDLSDPEYAIEVSYEGSYEVDEATLADGTQLDDHLSAMGGWISSVLVRVGDLKLGLPPPARGPRRPLTRCHKLAPTVSVSGTSVSQLRRRGGVARSELRRGAGSRSGNSGRGPRPWR